MELFLIIYQLFSQDHKGCSSPKGHNDMLPGCIFKLQIRLIAHHQHQRDIDEGLTAGKAVGIMKAMPDKIQYINRKTCVEKEQKTEIYCFFLYFNVLIPKIQEQEHQNSYPTVNIRPMIQSDLCLYVPNMAGDHVKYGKIGTDCLWKVKIS